MKRLLSILLAITMMFGLSITAFATGSGNLTIEGEGRTYNGYQLFTLTSALKDGAHHTGEENHEHTDECYIYSYKLNRKYETILKTETLEKAGANVWGNENAPTNITGVSEEHVKDYLSTLTSDSGSSFGSLRPAADRIYRAIKTASIAADATNLSSGANNTIDQGYWLFVDLSTQNGYDANSLVIVDTKGLDLLTIAPKTAIPVVEKKVRDIEDSEDNTFTDNAWHDSADYDIGDRVPFKLTGTMPSNVRAYETYKMVFHDTLSKGLEFDSTSLKVYMYSTKHLADVNTSLDMGIDVTEHFIVTENVSGTEGTSLEISCDNLLVIDGATSDTAFVVYYEATLENTAVVGADGNDNKVYLEYSNNPYGDGTGTTGIDTVKVFTYQLKITKEDSHGHALAGAGFTLWKKQAGSNETSIPENVKNDLNHPDRSKYYNGYRPVENEKETVAGDGGNILTWSGIDDGDYILSESTVPNGYNGIEDIVFTIEAIHSEKADNPQLISINAGVMGTYLDNPTGTIEMTIVNKTGTVLPSTGVRGTFILLSASSALVVAAVVFMVTRKKMSIYED